MNVAILRLRVTDGYDAMGCQLVNTLRATPMRLASSAALALTISVSANSIVAAFDTAGRANLSHSEWLMPGGSKSLEPCP